MRRSSAASLGASEYLNSVAPRIGRVQPTNTWKGAVPLHRLAGVGKPARKGIDIAISYPKSWMRLLCCPERLLDADVELLSAHLEPDASALLESLRLLNLVETEELAEEASGVSLTSWRGRYLDVIETDLHDDRRVAASQPRPPHRSCVGRYGGRDAPKRRRRRPRGAGQTLFLDCIGRGRPTVLLDWARRPAFPAPLSAPCEGARARPLAPSESRP